MKRTMIILGLLLALPGTAGAAVVGEEVRYRAGDTVMRGYLTFDDSLMYERPGILVVHEWWGHNAYARKRAEMLAALGYTALAVDMYGGGKQAEHPEDAARFAGELRQNLPLAKERFLAAMERLKVHSSVDERHLAAIGYCFGGGVVLNMAREGLDLDGVVSFHGSLGTERPAEPGAVKARILVFNGAEDPFVTEEEIAAFVAEMERAGADYTLVNLAGARHSFTNPDADAFGERFDLPLAYDAEADASSWRQMRAFLRDIFPR